MAAQEFRHTSQEEDKKVGDFIRRLEQHFKRAYGHDTISTETWSTLLYGQLQEGLRYRIMEAPAMSGTTDYRALCLAAKTEEKRLAELKKRYKSQYDRGAKTTDYNVGDWVFVCFPVEETGKGRKQSRPWYGPFQIVTRKDPNLKVSKVYFPEDTTLLVHELRNCPCPDMLSVGFYWYGAKRRSSGRTPNWLQKMLTMHIEWWTGRRLEFSGGPRGVSVGVN